MSHSHVRHTLLNLLKLCLGGHPKGTLFQFSLYIYLNYSETWEKIDMFKLYMSLRQQLIIQCQGHSVKHPSGCCVKVGSQPQLVSKCIKQYANASQHKTGSIG